MNGSSQPTFVVIGNHSKDVTKLKEKKMETKRLVDTGKLQKIMTDIVELFQANGLNDIEIALVTAELVRLNRDYQNIKFNKKDL